MKLKVVLNKDIAFSNYLRHVINLERWPWTKRGPLKRIPLELVKRAKGFGWPLKFSFERHPLKDLDGYLKEFKRTIKQAEKLHNQDWRKHQKELKETARILKEITEEYGDFILKTIARVTKAKWQYSEIWLIPSIYSGGTIVDNKIFIGFEKRPRDKFFGTFIHESIHVNEPPREELSKLMKELKLPTDSKEMATVILTNKVIDRLNNKFKLNIPHQNFHIYYRKFMAKLESGLKEISKNKNSFKSLIKSIDNFLIKKRYRGYYSKYIR